ncbi:Outer membrane protein assembly factor BamB, contains PQQ-like beta-propeller repeat [Halobiforma haloterrestris]|uniref:Outer membrane protein assembly factor BamB, contains PQQ-like beta-propeller repeat n=2 Tax=Natronobacterium haloterrestre TaxID=148448 RepID=A0A1I1JKY0_NATHA|nr:Outer membrane protein assembly factor BamB, contains PQQ-like beta-propeller repeat [Halobiforma haloterrestris]
MKTVLRMNRRELLATVSVSLAGVAGCLNGEDAGPFGESPDNGTAAEDDGEAPAGNAVQWTYQTGGSIRNQPTLQDGIVYLSGGTNDRARSTKEHVRPERSENVYALTADAGTEQWQYEAPAGVASSPIVRDGVFVVTGWSAGTHGIDQQLVRLDDGSETWTTEEHDRYLHLLDSSDGAVYLGTSDDEYGIQGEELFAIRASDGDQYWSIETGDTTDATIYGDTLYSVAGGRRTTAFAVGDGEERWHRDMRPGTDDVRVFDDALYLISEQENENGNYPVVAVSAGDGSERWRFSVPVDEPFVPTGAVASGDTVYITEYGGWLFGVDRADGSESWRYSVGSDTRDPPVVVDDMVYLASKNGGVHAVDATTGDREWRRTVPGQVRIVAGNQQGVIVRGGKEEGMQHLRAYAPDGTERWSFSHPDYLTRPAVDGTRAIVGTRSGYVAALAEQ